MFLKLKRIVCIVNNIFLSLYYSCRGELDKNIKDPPWYLSEIFSHHPVHRQASDARNRAPSGI